MAVASAAKMVLLSGSLFVQVAAGCLTGLLYDFIMGNNHLQKQKQTKNMEYLEETNTIVSTYNLIFLGTRASSHTMLIDIPSMCETGITVHVVNATQLYQFRYNGTVQQFHGNRRN